MNTSLVVVTFKIFQLKEHMYKGVFLYNVELFNNFILSILNSKLKDIIRTNLTDSIFRLFGRTNILYKRDICYKTDVLFTEDIYKKWSDLFYENKTNLVWTVMVLVKKKMKYLCR